MSVYGPDISHAQGAVDFAKIKAAGNTYAVLKATEGVGFVDPMFAGNRRAAHAAGLMVGIYHFSRDNAPAAEAAYFAGVVGALQPNEFLVLDQEVVHSIGNVAWSRAWLDATRAHFGVAPFIYLNKGNSTGVTSGNWTTVAQTYGLWLASYDNAPAAQTAVPYWGVPAMKQYTDKGSCPGVAGAVDLDVFYGTTAQLRAYCTPTGADMPLTPDDVNLILDTPVQKVDAAGKPIPGSTSSLRAFLAWDDPKTIATRNIITGVVQQAQADLDSRIVQPAPVDPKALADALVADTQAVSTLADALAAAIAHRLGNG